MANDYSSSVAEENSEALRANPYPGRGIILGLDETGKFLIQVYWIMGRSPDSRNRVFGVEGGRLFTEPVDPEKVKDPELIIYDAMDEFRGELFVVSNGRQTDDVVRRMAGGESLAESLRSWQYEPDGPNFTPRITGVCYQIGKDPVFQLAVLSRSMPNGECDRSYYQYDAMAKGFGRCITTYLGNGTPLPAFSGEPRLMPLPGDIAAVCDAYWERLNPDNRVSLAVKFISIDSGASTIRVVNKYRKAASAAA